MEQQERKTMSFVPHARASTEGFASLDEVDLAEVFEVRVCVMKSIPKFMRGAHCGAMKLSLQEIQRGSVANNSTAETGMEVVLSLAQVVALQTTPRWFGPSREVAGAHVQICGW